MNAGNPLFFQTWAEENVKGEGELNEIWDIGEGIRDGGEKGQLNMFGPTSEEEGRDRVLMGDQEEEGRARVLMSDRRLNGQNGLAKQGEESPQLSRPSESTERAAQDAMTSPQPNNSSGPNSSSPVQV
ncbi:hypothetical protein CRG98_012503 [Punica granatum]|uniref:Uncharacterized protein n=1 Tax=Punica granatum TaxID=22663 RepID=A0A2I0KEZ1_PUNGR|nr:hypothetical protein CRG98_012503 [Punica granatum]